MKKYECIKGLVFGDREIPPVKLGTNWVETYDKRPDNYVHLEQNGNPGDWLEIPKEAQESISGKTLQEALTQANKELRCFIPKK